MHGYYKELVGMQGVPQLSNSDEDGILCVLLLARRSQRLQSRPIDMYSVVGWSLVTRVCFSPTAGWIVTALDTTAGLEQGHILLVVVYPPEN